MSIDIFKFLIQIFTFIFLFPSFSRASWSKVNQPRQTEWPAAEDMVSIDASQDCNVKKFAYEYALWLHPELAPLKEVFDALELQKCGEKIPPPDPPSWPHFPTPDNAIFVDWKHGNDANPGTKDQPLKTLHKATDKAVRASSKTIALRSGVHFLRSTLSLTSNVSGLTIQNYDGEEAWISGGVQPTLSWTKHSDKIYVAELPSNFGQVLGLNTLSPLTRMTRARFPNRDPNAGTIERGWLPSGKGVTWMKPPVWPSPAKTTWTKEPNTEPLHSGDCGTHFTFGTGGPCDRYTPNGGYLCSANATGGGFGWETMVPGAPLFPIGLEFPSSMFTSRGVPSPADWKDSDSAIIQTWTNGWCTTMWSVDAVTRHDKNVQLIFGSGGQQTGRGFHADNVSSPIQGENWRIENAFELLDAPEEFYYSEKDHKLYLYYNGTDSPEKMSWVIPKLKKLIELKGSKSTPVKDITLRGLGFRDAAYTYMDEWGVPSGGDWALHRGGAIFLEGTSNDKITQCRFEQLDGNAVFLSGYTRNIEVSNSTFVFIGDSAVALWGYTKGESGEGLPNGVGINGTNGEQPRFTSMIGNIVREIGFNERQSSAFGEFKACQSHVEGNLFFNMPRAAININDGFGGGTKIKKNLLFNTCRESGDHGPFNSWDRQPFLTKVLDSSQASLIPAYNEISNNFIISNYGAGFGVDNDDTASYYNIYANFFYLGGGVKCDYDGHEKKFYENVMLGQGGGAACHHTCAYAKGYTDYCFNNKIIQANPRQASDPVRPFALIWFCDPTNPAKIIHDYNNQMLPIIHSNQIYNRDASATITCGYYGGTSRTTVTLKKMQDAGLMKNTTVYPLPDDQQVIKWAKSALGM